MSEIEIKVNTSELGVIYCLSNPAFSYLKIGKTNGKSAKDRAKELHTTGTPTPFNVLFAKRVINSSRIENEIHAHFKDYRVNDKREFFDVPAQQVLDYFLTINGVWDPPPSNEITTSYSPLEDKSTTPYTPFEDIIVPPAPPIRHVSKSKSKNTLIRQYPPAPSAPPSKNISIMDIYINNLTQEQTDILLQCCMNMKCMELRLISGYYFFDQILCNNPEITRDMRFNATLNSPEMGYISVQPTNFEDIICELVRNGPSAFIELDERLD